MTPFSANESARISIITWVIILNMHIYDVLWSGTIWYFLCFMSIVAEHLWVLYLRKFGNPMISNILVVMQLSVCTFVSTLIHQAPYLKEQESSGITIVIRYILILGSLVVTNSIMRRTYCGLRLRPHRCQRLFFSFHPWPGSLDHGLKSVFYSRRGGSTCKGKTLAQINPWLTFLSTYSIILWKVL